MATNKERRDKEHENSANGRADAPTMRNRSEPS